jgi:hypothetical protein
VWFLGISNAWTWATKIEIQHWSTTYDWEVGGMLHTFYGMWRALLHKRNSVQAQESPDSNVSSLKTFQTPL